MKGVLYLLFFLQLVCAEFVYSQEKSHSEAESTKYHYCIIRAQEKSQVFTFDFGNNTHYEKEMGLDTMKNVTITTILNIMSASSWELINVFVTTNYFFSTPQNTENWVIRKLVSTK